MFVFTEKLKKIENIISKYTIKDVINIIYIDLVMKHHLYFLLKDKKLKEIYSSIKKINNEDIIELLNFFINEIDITSDWYSFNNIFVKKYSNIYNTIIGVRKLINKLNIKNNQIAFNKDKNFYL